MAAQDVSLSPAEEASRDLHAILQDLQGALAGTLGSVLVDAEGFPLAWDLKGGADPILIATVSSMVSRLGDRATDVLDFGNMRNAIITTDKGSIAVFRVSPRLALVLLLQPSTNHILVMIEVSKALERLREVVVPGY
jgi:predicted regulator of Ras-like GTPase activity (Roadblock/LC7/MglB family)